MRQHPWPSGVRVTSARRRGRQQAVIVTSKSRNPPEKCLSLDDHIFTKGCLRYVKVSCHAYMKGDEIKISNHPILDSSDVFCVQGD